MAEIVEIMLPSGISVKSTAECRADWEQIRLLVESGVPQAEVAKHFKLDVKTVKGRSKTEGWLTPRRVDRMRKEIVTKQSRQMKLAGAGKAIALIKAEIWEERGERLRERSYEIAEAALEGVDLERAKTMIRGPHDFSKIVETIPKILGEKEGEGAKTTNLAVNVAFLRSSMQPIDIPVVDIP